MSLVSNQTGISPVVSVSPAKAFWLFAVVLTIILAALPIGVLPTWAVKFPTAWQVPLASWFSAFSKWLVEDASLGLFTVHDVTRALAWLLDQPLLLAKAVLASGFISGQGTDAVLLFPPIPWFGLIFFLAVSGYIIGGMRFGLAVVVGLLYLAVFGQWASSMITLASVLVASVIGALAGLFIGLACVRWKSLEKVVSPVLDLAQTMPVFAYLLPMLLLFGFGPVSAMVATVIYAMPPMIRVTIVAIRAVPEEVVSLGTMTGCTSRQVTWKILVPSALPALMIGVNQVIMLSLNVVIIASMIGAGGLGYDVLSALRRLDIGAGLEAGLAITVLAVLLDRFAQALARYSADARLRDQATVARRGHLIRALFVLLFALWLAAAMWPAIARYPEAWQFSTAPFWNDLVSWINITYFDALAAVKNAILLNLLVPLKRFMLSLPWPWVVAVVTVTGWRLSGARLGSVVLAMSMFMVVTGLWQASMTTVYLCGVAVVIAGLIGIPIGIAAAQRPRLWRGVEAVIDTLQTLPSFVYLIPIVMLFQVGDFTAMIAIVLYAIAPAIRYTAHGVARVHPALIEAGVMTGCTRRQILTRIRLPMALPEVLLGLNQTVMLALSMLVITALVGTRDLGQETYAALAKADVGRGVVAGLCVAFIGIIADRLISAASARLKRTHGSAN